MSRRRKSTTREIIPDPRFGDAVLAKFIRSLMVDGKKNVAESLIYSSFELIRRITVLIVAAESSISRLYSQLRLHRALAQSFSISVSSIKARLESPQMRPSFMIKLSGLFR